jgi:predicted RNA binding protein YcfA (HicA-like mRNA interferase family)
MPKKIRELKAMLTRAGFFPRSGKGSHQTWKHPSGAGRVVLSGNDGDDAKRYQERDVAREIAKIEKRQ